jgi:hypothetical protein
MGEFYCGNCGRHLGISVYLHHVRTCTEHHPHMICTSCKHSLAQYEIRQGMCLDCWYKEATRLREFCSRIEPHLLALHALWTSYSPTSLPQTTSLPQSMLSITEYNAQRSPLTGPVVGTLTTSAPTQNGKDGA